MISKFRVVIATIIAVFLSISILHADIYKYIDSNGVLHFTNMPISSGYQLYIKETPETDSNPEVQDQYDPIIQLASEKYGIDFLLVKAMIKAESNFDPWAVSGKGAMGLMQIMPDNFNELKINDPFNPQENILGGTRYLKILMKRFDGKLPLALAAYNAGPSVVDRYRRIPPYTETENYVKRVMMFYNQLSGAR
ncbi:MAG: transglycosylase SLT domain-containing protein [Desulfobacterales bacterium]